MKQPVYAVPRERVFHHTLDEASRYVLGVGFPYWGKLESLAGLIAAISQLPTVEDRPDNLIRVGHLSTMVDGFRTAKMAVRANCALNYLLKRWQTDRVVLD